MELSIAGFTITENEATQTANFTVTSNIPAEENIIFTLTTSDATAIDGDDYTAQTTQSYTLIAGQTAINLPVSILGDLIAEPTETFTGTIALTNANAQQVAITTDTATAEILDNDSMELSIAGFTITENEATQTTNFTVTSNIPAEENIIFTLTTSDATAIDGDDYTAQTTQSYTLIAGQTAINLPVSILGDLIAEPTETFTGTIALTNANAQQVAITTDTATAEILDNDSLELSIAGFTITENEATQTANFTVTSNIPAEENIIFTLTTSDATAIDGDDYTAQTTQSYTLIAGQTAINLPVSILGDLIAEPTETFTGTIALTNTNAQQVTITTDTATAEILDNDSLELSIAGFTITENEATQTANFTVTSNIPAEENIIFTLTTSDATAIDGDDYTAQTTQSYTLIAGQTAINLPVSILGDLIAEPTETFTGTIALTNANAQQVTITTDTATAEILDNDTATLSINDVSVNEDDGTATFTVTLTGNVQNDFTIDYSTADNTAITGDDYTTIAATTLTFGGTNNNIQTFSVTILDNNIAEPTETYFVNLSNLQTNGQTGITITENQGTGEILDNDSLELSIAGFTITENEATQTANFTVTSNIPAEENIIFTLTTSDATAIDGDDYTAQTTQSYTLIAGQTAINLPVSILGDLIAEPTETFTGTIALTNANAQQVTITTDTATAEILDNDSLELSVAGFTITENEATQTANFTVTSNIPAEENIIFTLTTSDATAIDGDDYTAQTTQSYTLIAGQTAINLPVSILGDLIAEPTETFTGTIALTNTNAQQVAITTDTATAEILDNDTATLSINDVSVNEDDGTATFTVTLTGNVQNDFTIDYSTADNTAITGDDYTTIAATTLTFGGTNNNIQTFSVTILDNNIAEPTETYFVNLSNLQTNGQTGITITENQGTGEILDNDSLELSIAGFTVTENEATQTANFTVTSNIPAEENIIFTLTTSDATAIDGDDYTAQTTQSYTLIAGQTAINLPVSILGDLIAEPTETFTGTIALTNTNAQQVTITTDTATAEILDNDSLELSIAGFTITENEATQTANFTVTSNIPAEENIIFTLTTSDATAIDGDDYTAQTTQSYTLIAGQTAINLPVSILGDLIAEPTETFTGTIALTNANAQQVAITTDTATAEILDNDSMELSIAGFTITENEATQTTNFTVTSNIPAEENIIFTLTTSDATAIDGDDYTAQTTQSYTLIAGQTAINLPVSILGDLIAEPTETFTGTIALTNANAQQVAITTDTATAEILDNDSLELSIAGFTITENEATQTANFTVTSNIPAEENIIFTLTTSDATAIDGDDYTAQTTQSYTLIAGQTAINLPVSILGDLIAEPTETFTGTIALTNTNAQQVAIITDTATAEILDNDSLELSIAGFTITENEATQTANFTVTSNIPAEENIIFTLTTSDATAIDGDDYTAQTTQSYTLIAGQTAINLPVSILGDLIAEPTETFTGTIALTNTNAQQVTITTDTVTAEILDNDSLELSIAGFTITENEATQTENFTVTSNIPAEENIIFTLTTSDATAIDGDDYTAQTTQSYTLIAGQTAINLPVSILGDLIAEPTETFTGTIALTNTNAQQVAITTDTATAEILDNDSLELSIAGFTITENEATQTANFTVTSNIPAEENIIFTLTTSDATAIDGDDYTAQTTQSYTLIAGQTAINLPVSILGDLIAEPTETFTGTIALTNANAQQVAITTDTATAEILDNDSMELSIAGFTITENEATQTANFTVTSNIPAEENIIFTLTTSDATAIDGDDYTAQTTQSYTLIAGQTAINLPVSILGDLIAEPTETFTGTIALTNTNAQQVAIITDTATAEILDNDSLELSIAGFTITENEATQTANFTVTSNIPAEENIIFTLTTSDATAIDGDDYTAQTTQSYTLIAGQTAINLPVSILGDLIAEPTETFTGTIALTNANAQQVAITTDTATAEILDNDSMELSIAGFTITENEATQTANFTVTSNIPAEENIIFTLTTSDATAIDGDDYTAQTTQSYTLIAGQTAINLPVSILGDLIAEPTETFTGTIALTNTNAQQVTITTDTATAEILDNDSMELSIAGFTITENEATQTANFTVTSNIPAEENIIFTLTTSDATAIDGDDYTAQTTQSYTLIAGQTAINLPVSILGDLIAEPTETFTGTIALTNANAQQVAITTDTATAEILDNDSMELSIAGFTITENEATQTTNFTVTSNIPAEENIIFTLTTSDATAIDGDDYTAQTTQSYTLIAGQTAINLPVSILGDLIAEPTETFTGTIALTNANAQQVAITTDTATAEILDNDSLELSIAGFTITENEATQTANFTVTSNIPAEENIIFTLTTSDATAIDGDDYTAQTTQSYTLIAGQTAINLPVSILGDLIAEPTETFTGTIALTNTNAQQVTITTDTATAEILDNDSLELSIAGFTITENEATQTANFTVTSNIPAEENIIFTLTTSDATAIDGDDYTAQTTQSYTLIAGQTAINLPVSILGDLIAEPTETFTGTIALTNTNAQQVAITTDTATAEILDNDSLELSIAGFTITENEATQTANFTVTSNIPAEENIIFTLTTSDATAIDGDDYTAQTTQSYTLIAGQTAINLPVSILGDLIAEPTETFTGTIALTNANAQQVAITTDTATAEILDNDSLELSIAGFTITENEATQTANFTVTSNIPAEENIIFTLTTSDATAIDGDDYTAQTTQSYTLIAGQTAINLPVSILGDLIAEPTETFTGTIALTNTNAQQVAIITDTATAEILDNDSLELSIAGFTITENEATQTANFTVTSNIPAEENIIFTLTTSDATAIDGDDYTAQTTQSYTLIAGQTAINLPVSILGDLIAEPTETFTGTIALTNTNAQQVTITTDTVTAEILDNDSLELSIAGFTVTENEATQTANFTVTSNIPAEENIIFTLTTSDATAIDGDDYTAQTTQSYTLIAGQTAINLPVSILGDLIAEPTETFTGTIALTNTNAQQVTITTDTATAEILDNDSLELSIAGFTITENEATQTANFTVTSNIPAEENIIFTLTTSDATAIDGDDYTAQTTQSYTLIAGQTAINLPVSILGDLIAEPTETFTGTIALTNANAQQVAITTDTATAEILDNDSMELSIAGFTITENEATQTTNFTVTSNIPAEENIIFTLTTSDATAIDGDDYTAQTTQSYTLIAGQTAINLPVSILGDLIAEPTETFTGTIALTNTNAQQVTITTDTVTAEILDNDSLELSIAGFTITENEATQTENFTVTSNIPAEENIIFTLTTSDATAIDGDDYTAQTTQSYTLIAGQTAINLPVSILGDLIAEPTETFTGTIALTNTNAQQVAITTDTATAEILDNDTVTLSINDVSVNEDDGTATFTVTLTGNVQNDFTIDYSTADNTAITGDDYTTIAATTLTFGGTNNNIQTFSVTILDNNIAEPTETYFVNLSNLQTNGQTGITITENQGTAEILDNDSLELSIAGFTITENEATQTENFTVTSNIPAEENIIFILTTSDATAIDGDDYTAQTTQSYTLIAGQTAINLPVSILGDLIVEPTETFTGTIALTNANAQQVAITTDTATAEILDNDGSIVSIVGTAQASEPNTNGLFTVNLSNPVSIPTIINYNITGTAIENLDYTALSGSLTIPTGNTSGTIEVPILDDLILEEEETIIITITQTNNSVIIGTESEAFITISDNDNSEVNIVSTTQASEPNTDGIFTLNLSNPVSIATTISYAVSGTANPDEDYTALNGSIIIPAGDISGIIDISVIDDLDVEGIETVIISLTETDNDVTIAENKNSTTVSINDNDLAEVNILALTNASEPSTTGEFEIILDKPVGIDTSISYSVQGIATADLDYVQLNGVIIIPANTTSVIIPIEVIDDDIVEFNGETLSIALETVENVLVIGPQSQAIIIIEDDEIPNPVIELIKTANLQGNGELGDIITYTFVINNIGNVPLDFIEINDPLLDISPIPIEGILLEEEEISISIDYQITQADIDVGNVTNTAYIFAVDSVLNTTIDDISDNGIEEDGDDNPTIVELSQIESIALIKTSRFNDENNDGISQIGETITYEFTVTNTGNVTLFDITIEDDLPGLILTGESITLEPGESDNENFFGTYTITVEDISNQKVTNQATVFGTTNLGLIVQDLSDNLDNFGDNPTETLLSGCEIKIYNAVTPDENGSNDSFIIEGIECYPNNKVEIFNRWGRIVYETKQYDNINNVFRGFSEVNGTIGGSDGLPTGTYFYIINYTDFQGQTRMLSGYLYITGKW
ncbi:Calx-beta domain-containing protein [Aquimarina sp. Aq107]|uniref:Calx-beta domain-containing protein n=1 Tax=Aquimarina sp. Aq107 TaxID=1191912 RepID=UPI0020B3BD73